MFLAMELWEGPFFGILRGIKPSWRYTKRDLELHAIVRQTEPDFVDEGRMELTGVEFAAPAFVDLDGDGDDDVLMGSQRGGLWYFERR